jgi:6-phosphogluconolactonase
MPESLLVVGSYNGSRPGRDAIGEGVSLLALDTATGALTTRDVLGGMANPSYLRVQSGLIHSVIETAADTAGLATLAVRDGRLTLLAQVAADGDGPCHVDIHPGGRFAAVACYGSGHVGIHPLDNAGVLQPSCCVTLHEGSGPNPARQAGPHAHAVCFAPDGNTLLVADLGTDEIWCHGFDAATGVLQADPPRFRAPPGSGPRLLLFNPAGEHLLLLTELGNTVLSLRWDGSRLTQRAIATTLPTGWTGTSTAAGLRWHPDGLLFAASNRGADSIALFRFDAGNITQIANVPAGGAKPRDFEFSPCGRWLLVAAQDDDHVAVHAVHGESLVDTGIRHPIGTPSCVRFLEPPTP